MMNFNKLQYISILLIEDNKSLSNKIINSFENIFEYIFTANDADEALEIYKDNIENIDMIFVDIEEEKDLYAIETITEVSHSIPVLAFVYPNEVSLLMQLFDYEVHTFLVKPVNTYKLLRKINKLAEMIVYKNELKVKEKVIDENLIYSQTDVKGIITYVSKPFINISGYSKTELIGKPHNIIRHPDVDSCIFEDLWKTIKSGKTWTGEIKNLKNDGGYYIVKSVVSPIYNKNRIIGFGSARLDITQLEKNSKQLHLHSKYKAMNEMLSMVSHHWRQPISSIGLEVDNALLDITMGELDKKSIVDSLNNINKQVKDLSNTIDTFKGFLEKSSKQMIYVDKLIKNVLFVVEGLLQENDITLNINKFIKNKILFTYQSELINVLLNIIINAKENIIKNSIQNGYITISSKVVYDNTLEIKISDNGGGVDSKIIENIFEPYISSKSAKNGTGLGLYIVKELVENKLNGSIYVENVENGAEFTLNIQGVVNG